MFVLVLKRTSVSVCPVCPRVGMPISWQCLHQSVWVSDFHGYTCGCTVWYEEKFSPGSVKVVLLERGAVGLQVSASGSVTAPSVPHRISRNKSEEDVKTF